MKPISRNDPLLVLQSTQWTPHQIVVAAKAYAHTRWLMEEKLRKTLAGANYLNEKTVHQSGSRQALLAPVLSSSIYKQTGAPFVDGLAGEGTGRRETVKDAACGGKLVRCAEAVIRTGLRLRRSFLDSDTMRRAPSDRAGCVQSTSST